MGYGHLNYTSVLTNSVILLGLTNAPRNLNSIRDQNTLIPLKMYMKLIPSTCSSFWLTTYLLYICWTCFQQTVGIPIGTKCAPFIRTEQTSYMRILKKIEKRQPDPLISIPLYRWCRFTNKLRDFCLSHLSHWAWNNECHRYS